MNLNDLKLKIALFTIIVGTLAFAGSLVVSLVRNQPLDTELYALFGIIVGGAVALLRGEKNGK